MIILNNITKKISFFLSAIIIFNFLYSCGIYQPSDARKVSPNSKERVKKNLEEGKGISIGKMMAGGGGGTNYQFASSNPMWRATLEILDFLPLSTVDYSGGVIISDWYSDQSNQQDSIKISVRFLSNELQSNSLNIIVHKRSCTSSSNCNVKKIKSKIEEELKISILKKAALLEKESKEKKK